MCHNECVRFASRLCEWVKYVIHQLVSYPHCRGHHLIRRWRCWADHHLVYWRCVVARARQCFLSYWRLCFPQGSPSPIQGRGFLKLQGGKSWWILSLYFDVWASFTAQCVVVGDVLYDKLLAMKAFYLGYQRANYVFFVSIRNSLIC